MGHDGASNNTMQGTEGDELGHVLAESRKNGANKKDDDATNEENLAAIEIGEFTNDWDADSGSKEIGGEGPAEVLEAVQLADNLGHGGGDDSFVEGRHGGGE